LGPPPNCISSFRGFFLASASGVFPPCRPGPLVYFGYSLLALSPLLQKFPFCARSMHFPRSVLSNKASAFLPPSREGSSAFFPCDDGLAFASRLPCWSFSQLRKISGGGFFLPSLSLLLVLGPARNRRFFLDLGLQFSPLLAGSVSLRNPFLLLLSLCSAAPFPLVLEVVLVCFAPVLYFFFFFFFLVAFFFVNGVCDEAFFPRPFEFFVFFCVCSMCVFFSVESHPALVHQLSFLPPLHRPSRFFYRLSHASLSSRA